MSAAAAAQAFDPAALAAWTSEVEERLGEHTASLTGLHVQLGSTITQAKAAMEAIVASVSYELLAFKRQVHVDHGKLDELVGHLQRKFQDVESVVQGLAGETAAKFAAVDARAGRAEQRIMELSAMCEALPTTGPAAASGPSAYGPTARLARPAPGESPPGSPRPGPAAATGAGGPARFMQHAGTDPWQPLPQAAAARFPQSAAPLLQPPGFAGAPVLPGSAWATPMQLP